MFRHCKPVLAAWLAEYPEYSNLHHLERHVCFCCMCPKKELRDYVPPDKQHPWRNHNLYRTLSEADTTAANAELSSRHVDRGLNVVRHSPCIVSDLPNPDLLHTMQIGILDHLQQLIFHFMNKHERLDKYNAIWLSVPSYHHLTPTNESYEEVSQWTGKEMMEMSQYLCGVVTQSPQGGSPAQRPVFNHTIECTWALLECDLYPRYQSHDDATLSYMEYNLHHFHTFKHDSLLGQDGRKAKAQANALRTELVMM